MLIRYFTYLQFRMSAAREKNRAARAKKREAIETSEPLVQPIALTEPVKEKQKIRIAAKQKSALVPGGGQSMGMEID
jgi:large subunit ribosomal protein L24e